MKQVDNTRKIIEEAVDIANQMAPLETDGEWLE